MENGIRTHVTRWWSVELIKWWQRSYHGVDGGFSFTFLQSFSRLLPAADLLWRQAQQPTHLLPEEVSVPIINRPIVCQYLHSRDLVALRGKHNCLIFHHLCQMTAAVTFYMEILLRFKRCYWAVRITSHLAVFLHRSVDLCVACTSEHRTTSPVESSHDR